MLRLDRDAFIDRLADVPIAEHDFHLVARAAVLSFIIVFGVTKALTNYAAGRLSDAIGRKQVLVVGWLVATPVPFLLMWAPSGAAWRWGSTRLPGMAPSPAPPG